MSRWPFQTEEQARRYDDLSKRGYALLRQAHELFMRAYRQHLHRPDGRAGS